MKAIALLSDGIDSPMAAYFALKQKVELVFLHCGWNETALSKVKENVKLLQKLTKSKAQLYTVDFASLQKELFDNCRKKFMCVLCKRSMYRVAEALANELSAECIITGENLGQVASQTLENMAVLDKAVKMRVVRPLIAFDKQEIIDMAIKTGTYNTAIIKNVSCPFVPYEPSTAAKEEVILTEESRIDLNTRIAELIKNKKKIF